MKYEKNALEEKFVNFINELSDEKLKRMCEAMENIYLEGGDFYIFPRGYKDDTGGFIVYDSEGQADVPISPNNLRKQLIEDAECLLQPALFCDDSSYEN